MRRGYFVGARDRREMDWVEATDIDHAVSLYLVTHWPGSKCNLEGNFDVLTASTGEMFHVTRRWDLHGHLIVNTWTVK